MIEKLKFWSALIVALIALLLVLIWNQIYCYFRDWRKKTTAEKLKKMPSWDYYVLAFLMALCMLCWAIKPFWWFRNG